MKIFTKKSTIGLLFAAALFLVLSGLSFYRNSLQENLTVAGCKSLNDIMEQQRISFSAQIKEQQSVIKTYARFFNDSNMGESDIERELDTIAKNSNFSYMSYVDTGGKGVRNTGDHFDISDKEHFARVMQGETVVSGAVTSAITGGATITFSTPVLQGGEVVGVLNGVYNFDRLTAMFPPSFGEMGHTYITTGAGEIMSSSTGINPLARGGNLLESLKQMEYQRYDNYEDILGKMALRQQGHSLYSINGENRLLHYASLDMNDWFIFIVTPETFITKQAQLIMRDTTIFMLCVCVIFLLLLFYFINEHRVHIRELSAAAFTDELTGLYNKKKFKLAAEELICKGTAYAYVILDIDKFKVLNDTMGYLCGDKLLITIADIIRENIRPSETFGRGDSDQFFMLLEYTNAKALKARINKVITSVTDVFHSRLTEKSYKLILCAGVYVISDSDESINTIGDRAKHAQQLIKGGQISNIMFYNEQMRNQILREKEIENRMQEALEKEEFLMYLQPKIRLSTGEVYGSEALARWNYKGKGLIYPMEFIPLFERNGFVTKLDMYILEKACQYIRQQVDAGIRPVTISINFSRLNLKNPNFVAEIAEKVGKYDVSPQFIEIELTESTMHDNETTLIDVLGQLHANGFTLSMDDFGSGYSSLGLLKNLSVDAVKLDRTFFTEYSDLKRAKTVIANMINMTNELGIYTVAEGVETQESIDLLKELGCDLVQGYYFAQPMSSEKFSSFLFENSR